MIQHLSYIQCDVCLSQDNEPQENARAARRNARNLGWCETWHYSVRYDLCADCCSLLDRLLGDDSKDSDVAHRAAFTKLLRERGFKELLRARYQQKADA
jgi:hypothetical protein